MGITGIHAIPMMITCMLQGTLCDTGIPRTFYGENICSEKYPFANVKTCCYMIWILFATYTSYTSRNTASESSNGKSFLPFQVLLKYTKSLPVFYVCMYVTYAHQPEMKNLEIGRGKKHEIKKFVCKYVLIYFYFFLFHLFLPTKYSYIGF